jgi:hypothetical protein
MVGQQTPATQTIGGSNTTKIAASKIMNLNSSFHETQQAFNNFNDSIDIDLYMSQNQAPGTINTAGGGSVGLNGSLGMGVPVMGKTSINFAKTHNQTMQNSRMGMHQGGSAQHSKKYSPQPNSGRQNSPQNPANLSF